jgi:hypothetical protein
MQGKYILAYILVSLLPSLSTALVILRLEPGQPRQALVWTGFTITILGSSGAEYLAKWLKGRFSGVLEEAVLSLNLVLMTFALITISFISGALLAFFFSGIRPLALIFLLVGLLDAGLAARSVLKAGRR